MSCVSSLILNSSDEDLLTEVQPSPALLPHALPSELVAEKEVQKGFQDGQVVLRRAPTPQQLLSPSSVEHDHAVIPANLEELLCRQPPPFKSHLVCVVGAAGHHAADPRRTLGGSPALGTKGVSSAPSDREHGRSRSRLVCTGETGSCRFPLVQRLEEDRGHDEPGLLDVQAKAVSNDGGRSTDARQRCMGLCVISPSVPAACLDEAVVAIEVEALALRYPSSSEPIARSFERGGQICASRRGFPRPSRCTRRSGDTRGDRSGGNRTG